MMEPFAAVDESGNGGKPATRASPRRNSGSPTEQEASLAVDAANFPAGACPTWKTQISVSLLLKEIDWMPGAT
jgi:hypothetical protein